MKDKGVEWGWKRKVKRKKCLQWKKLTVPPVSGEGLIRPVGMNAVWHSSKQHKIEAGFRTVEPPYHSIPALSTRGGVSFSIFGLYDWDSPSYSSPWSTVPPLMALNTQELGSLITRMRNYRKLLNFVQPQKRRVNSHWKGEWGKQG